MSTEHGLKERKQSLFFSRFNGDSVMEHFNNAISFSMVFMIIKLGWEPIYDISNDLRPILIALLCFFHVAVYWLNFHHFLKFVDDESFSAAQTWTVALLALGIVLYPLSLSAWLERGDMTLYLYVNLFICAALNVWNLFTRYSAGNSIFKAYVYLGTPAALVWYLVVLLSTSKNIDLEWMIWLAPFLFCVPLGAARDKA